MDKKDGYTLKVIGQDNRSDDQYNPEQLKIGVDIEKEHTDQVDLAKSIAKDHLDEIPDYYTRLVKMEKEAENKIEEIISRFMLS